MIKKRGVSRNNFPSLNWKERTEANKPPRIQPSWVFRENIKKTGGGDGGCLGRVMGK